MTGRVIANRDDRHGPIRTQAEVARILGVTPATVAEIEASAMRKIAVRLVRLAGGASDTVHRRKGQR